MNKYIVIYGMPSAAMAEMMNNSTPEGQKKEMEDWTNWTEANKASFVDMGNPVGKNTRVTKDGAEDVSNEIAGYSIMQAESKEALTALLQTCPHFEFADTYIELMSVVEM